MPGCFPGGGPPTPTSTDRRPLSVPLHSQGAVRGKRKGPSLPVRPRQKRFHSAAPDVILSPGQITPQLSHPPREQGALLPEETLHALRNTRSLFLCSRNIFSFAQIRHLKHMTQLSSINVHMNAISRIKFLGHLRHLTELDISANELRVVDKDAFVGLGQLKRLNLSSNFLTKIDGLEHLPALEWFSLSFNELESIKELHQLPCPDKLLHFDICGNKIAKLVDLESALNSCHNLQELCVQTAKTALVLSAVLPQMSVRENPFCASEPNYAERLFQRFQRLIALNGEPCGIDPIAPDTLRRSALVTTETNDDSHYKHTLDLTTANTVSVDAMLPLFQDKNQQQNQANFSEVDFVLASHAVNTSSVSQTAQHSLESTTGASSSNSNGSEAKSSMSTGGSCCASLPWRTKKVSRAVLTTVSIPLHKELHLSEVGDGVLQEEIRTRDETIEHLELRIRRLQEQLLLRVALEQDLRRNFKVVRQAHVELAESAASEKKLLSRQVAALKDELLRRSEEAVILQRKNRAELEDQAKALRAELQRQKKESFNLVKQLKEQLARVCNEASHELRELKVSLSDAVKQNKLLEQQNQRTQSCLEVWRNESQRSNGALVTCEVRLEMFYKLHRLVLEELLTRRQLEFEAWGSVIASIAALFSELRHANIFLVTNQHNCQRAWEEYVISLQREHKEALLKSQMTRAAQVMRVDIGCDPIRVSNLVRVAWDEEETELKRLQTALALAHQSEKLLSSENERLLRCLAEQERELSDVTQRLHLSTTAAQEMEEKMRCERENILRTLHNLRETIKKKDEALDELEAEANVKINEKRSAIARLEERLREVEVESAGHRSDVARLRSELEDLQSARTAAEQCPELLAALEDAKRRLASSILQENQQSLKLTRAAEALSLVRGELAKVAEANRCLTKELDERTAQLRVSEGELARLRAQWQESQQAARARHRAALQALSQIMTASSEDES